MVLECGLQSTYSADRLLPFDGWGPATPSESCALQDGALTQMVRLEHREESGNLQVSS